MDLIDQLQTLAARAKQVGTSLTNEEATKMALIAPFIQALGYDIFRAPRKISKSQRFCRHEKAAKEAAEKENAISTIGKIF